MTQRSLNEAPHSHVLQTLNKQKFGSFKITWPAQPQSHTDANSGFLTRVNKASYWMLLSVRMSLGAHHAICTQP